MKTVKWWLQFPVTQRAPNGVRDERLSSVLLHDYILMYVLLLSHTLTPLDYLESVIQSSGSFRIGY